jgi:hypothetical protein
MESETSFNGFLRLFAFGKIHCTAGTQGVFVNEIFLVVVARQLLQMEVFLI